MNIVSGKNKILQLIFFILTIIMYMSCSDNAGKEMLDRVDALVDEHPDSAMTLLESMDDSYRKSTAGTARHSLLLTLATLKTRGLDNVGKEEVDSLFRPAYEYYGKKTEPSRENMLFHFISALVQDSDEVRLKEYDRSIELAAGRGEWDYKALSWLHKSLIYYKAVSSEDEIACIDSALLYNDKVERTDVRSYIAESAGRANFGLEDDLKAEKYYLDFLRLSNEIGDSILINQAKLNLGSVYRLQGRYDESVALFDAIANSNSYCPEFSAADLCNYAISLIEKKRIKEAEELISILEQSDTAQDKLCYYTALTRLKAAEGDYKEAYALNDSITVFSNKLVIEKMRYRLPRKEKELERKFSELSKISYERKITIQRLFASLFILVLLSVIIILAYFFQRKRLIVNALEKDLLEREKYDKNLEKQIRMVTSQKENAEKMLRENKMELDEEMKEYKKEVRKSIEIYEGRISELIKEKSENLLVSVRTEAKLCNKNISSNDKEKRNRGKLIIEKYRDKDLQQKLINAINENSNNIIEYIRSKNILTDDGLLIVLFDICTFNYVAMGELFGITSSNASARKSRVKQKLTSVLDESNRKWLAGYIPMLK